MWDTQSRDSAYLRSRPFPLNRQRRGKTDGCCSICVFHFRAEQTDERGNDVQRKRWRTEGTRVAFPQTSRVISSLTSVCLTSQPQTQYFHLNLRGQLNQLHHRGNYICAALIYSHLCADDIKALAWANCLVLHCNNSNTISDISPCGGIHNLLLCTVHMCTSWR